MMRPPVCRPIRARVSICRRVEPTSKEGGTNGSHLTKDGVEVEIRVKRLLKEVEIVVVPGANVCEKERKVASER